MKKAARLTVIFCCIISVILLSSCSGFNPIMRKHLSDPNNYKAYHAEIKDICYYGDYHRLHSIFSSDTVPDSEIIFELSFSDYDSVQEFCGASPNPDIPLEEYCFLFRVTKKNNLILKENGFYDAVEKDTPIDIVASDFIYMDGNFFFIAEVVYNETEYLPLDTGFDNIVTYVRRNWSLL